MCALIDKIDGQVAHRELCGQVTLGEQQCNLGVGQQIGEALSRIVRVNGDIGCAAL